MARETVGLYIRLSSDRTYRKVNPKSKTQPAGKFCLRYKHGGKRVWRTVAGTDLNLAIAVKKRQEADVCADARARGCRPASYWPANTSFLPLCCRYRVQPHMPSE